MALVKSGWLWRQSSILRRWKRNWFVLYLDGSLPGEGLWGTSLAEAGSHPIPSSLPLPDVQPPEGRSRDCLLTVVLRDGSKTTLCAESEDDAAAYISSGHYGHQYGGGWPGGPGGVPEAVPTPLTALFFPPAAPGVTHVIVREDPYRVSGDQMALGLLAGAATGAALGSFMWMPCWF
ncbi:PKHB1 protein, partial [Chloropsis hardwickii]|nr:PKHB1 protein [Chloropsis hardwickii]